MKLFYFCILALLTLTTTSLAAQSLTAANCPQTGDVYSIAILDSAALNPAAFDSSGIGQTWDFSTCTVDSTISLYYINPSTAPAPSYFPGTDLVSLQSGANGPQSLVYTYYNTSNAFAELGTYTSFSVPNTSIQEIQVLPYNPSFVCWTYPLNYGTTQVSKFKASSTVFDVIEAITASSDSDLVRTGTDTVTLDATGTVITPDGMTIANVLRVKSIQTIHDSINTIISSGIELNEYSLSNTRSVTYFYYVQGATHPLIKLYFATTVTNTITSGVNLTGAVTTTSKTGQYYQVTAATGITAATAATGLSVYPNPANGVVTISLTSAINSLTLANVTGQLVLSSAEGSILINGNTASINVSALPKGVYILQSTSNSVTQSQKLIVE